MAGVTATRNGLLAVDLELHDLSSDGSPVLPSSASISSMVGRVEVHPSGKWNSIFAGWLSMSGSAGKNTEQIELLELGNAGIHVAEYLTVLPPREVLREKPHKSN